MADKPKYGDDRADLKARARALLLQSERSAPIRKAATEEPGPLSDSRARAKRLLDQNDAGVPAQDRQGDKGGSEVRETLQATPSHVDGGSDPQERPARALDGRQSTSVEIRCDIAPMSVVIATFNRANLLAAALKSCGEQSVRPRQVIVIDDGSDDSTSRVVGEFEALDVVYVNPGHIGLGNARNLATALCQTRYLCVLDDDDIMLPNRIRDHMATFSEGAQISHGGWINFNERNELVYWPGKKVTEDVIVYVGAAMTHGACCYETSLLREFPYRGDLVGGADYDMAARAVSAGANCAHTGSYVLLRRMHEASTTARHAEGQGRVRNSIAAAINLVRDDSEIARRTSTAFREPELIAIDCPRLDELYAILGTTPSDMRLAAALPRRAGELFALLDRLAWNWSEFDFVDVEKTLTSTLKLVSRGAMDVSMLSAAEIALRHLGIKCHVQADDNDEIRSTAAAIDYKTPPGYFRVLLSSVDLNRLHAAYRGISSERNWSWYVQARRDEAAVRRTRYTLVTAPFEIREGAEQQHAHIENIRTLIRQHTDLECQIQEVPS